MEKFDFNPSFKKEEAKDQSFDKENESKNYKKLFADTLLKWKNVLSFAALLGLSGVSTEALAQYQNRESIPVSKEYLQNLEQQNLKLDSLITVLMDLSGNEKEPSGKGFAPGGLILDLQSSYISKNLIRFHVYRYELNSEHQKEYNMITHGNDIYLDNQRIELVSEKGVYKDGSSYVNTHSNVSEYGGDIPVQGCRLDNSYKAIYSHAMDDSSAELRARGYKQADFEEALKKVEKTLEREIESFKK